MGIFKLDIKDRIIVALDTSSTKEAEALMKDLKEEAVNYKVGLEQYLASDGKMVDILNKNNKNVFLDLKFHDIPNTVSAAAREAVKKNIWMFNIHVTALETMKGAVEVTKKEADRLNIQRPLIIGVTILTSLSKYDLKDLGYIGETGELAVRRASLAKKAGLDGVVASPKEVRMIKDECGDDFVVVCPGVRPEWSQKDDQKRFMTPKEALQEGADYLVVGRPVTKAKDPVEAISMIYKEMSQGSIK